MADSTSFTVEIDVPVDSVASASSAIERLNSQLEESTKAASAASEAVRAGEASYKLAETAATKAAQAVEKIGLAAQAQQGKLAKATEAGDATGIERATAAIAALAAKQGEASSKAAAATAAMNAEAAALDKLKGASKAADAIVDGQNKAKTAAEKSKKVFADQAQAQAKSVGAAGELEGALGKLGGPLGAVGQKVAGTVGSVLKLGKSLGDAGPYVAAAVGMALVVAALAAVAAAAIAGIAAITHWAVTLADAARTQGLLNAGLAKSVAGGVALGNTFDTLANKIPLPLNEMQELAKPLIAAGLKGKDLENALERAGIKAATIKFGPEFRKELISLPSLTARLQTNFSRMFSGLKIEKLLESLGDLVALFDKGSESSEAIKVVFESLFQPLVDGVTGFVPMFISAFLQFEIMCLKAMIAIKPWASTLVYVGIVVGVLAAVLAGVLLVAVLGIAISLGVLAAAIAVVVAIAVALVAGFLWLCDAAQQVTVAIIDGLGSAFNWLKGLSLSEIGTQLIDGLVSGLMAAGPKVLESITGIAKGAITAAKKALGIASPSKVFAEIGMHTAAGMSEGVDDHASTVAGSLESMVAPPPGLAGGAAAAGGSSSVSTGGHVFNIVVNGGGGQSLADQLREVIQDLLAQGGGTAAPSG